MNKIIRYLILLLLLGSSSIAQEVLTVDSVVQMVKAGFSEKIILQRVRSNPGHYGLTTQKMVELKRSGVPVSVLSEMLEKDQQNQSQIEQSKPTADSCRVASRDWVTTSGQDSLTGAPFVAAEKVLSVGSGSCVRVTASCKSDTTMERLNESPLAAANPMETLIGSMGMAPPGYSPDKQPRTHFDTRTLNFVLQYVPAPRSGLSLLASPMKQTLTTYGNNPVGYVSPPSACVRLRVMVDDTGREGVASDRCNVQNLASISFPAARLSDAFASMSSPRSGGNAEINTFVSKLMDQVYSSADQTVATMQQALVSQQIRIELPLTDGSSTIVTIQPQEPAFQRFVTSCLSTFPNPSLPEPAAPPPPVDSFVPGTAETLASRTFEGSIDQFAAELPGYVNRALVLTHLPPRDYTKEIMYIIDHARTCLSITPQMVAGATVNGRFVTGRLGSQYAYCGQPDNGKPQWAQYATNVSDSVGGGGGDYSRRDLKMRINPLGSYASGQGITVTVFFEFRQSDDPSFASNLDTDASHRIVLAKVIR